MAWQTNDCPLNAGVKQDRRMSQTGFTPLDSGGCKPVNVSHHRNCPPVSLKHERDTLAQRAKTGQIIDTSNSASAGKRRAEHYCPRPLFGGRAWNESRTFVPKCLRGWPLSSSGMTRTV
ncbi:hypothetical protein RB4810 [Rhodopirellula baltica SH 1]|uniref:Uncharacterized protein n=1 Tax=Rhodopirellula baltica (strain DSM 10527 / NCIMB 13988 / SH1) TaxID=243090 RepID=Q7UH67_RHOBA|nr:hypothetical protein RB4810 [Rhodopirellula baltica SH 1]